MWFMWRRIWCVRPVTGRCFDQGVAAGRVAVHRHRQFDGRQRAEARQRRLQLDRLGPFACSARVDGVIGAAQRVVDLAGCRRMTAHQHEVTLGRRVLRELFCQRVRRHRVEREHQHAGGAAVQPVHRPHALTDLVAQQLHGELRFVAVQRGAMHQQSGRLVDHDHRGVVVKDVQHA
jgi:hypothetical protein